MIQRSNFGRQNSTLGPVVLLAMFFFYREQAMANFFDSSCQENGDSSEPGAGDGFFSFKDTPTFKNDESSGRSFFDNASAMGEHQESFFKSPSKGEKFSLDLSGTFSKSEGVVIESEPTFLAPFSKTPPRKRQNQGPSPSTASRPPYSANPTRHENTPLPLQRLGAQDSPNFASSNTQVSGGAFPFPQQSAPGDTTVAYDQDFQKMNSQQTTSTHCSPVPVIGSQAPPMRELGDAWGAHLRDSQGNYHQEDVPKSMRFESSHEAKDVLPGNNVGKNLEGTALPPRKSGNSVCKGSAAALPQIDNQEFVGKTCGQDSRPVEEIKGSVQQLLVCFITLFVAV